MWQCASMIRCGCVVVAISVLSEGRAGLRDARLPLLLGREALWRHQRRAVDEPGAIRPGGLGDLELEAPRPAPPGDPRRRVQRAAAGPAHLEAVRAERRDVLEQDDPWVAGAPRRLEPLGRDLLAALARDLAVAVAEGGVAHRLH